MEIERTGDMAIPVDEASHPTPPTTPPSTDHRVVKVRRSYRFGSYTTRRTYKAMQVIEKRKGRKSSTKRSRLSKGPDKITDALRANSSTADIRGSDIAGASLGIAMPLSPSSRPSDSTVNAVVAKETTENAYPEPGEQRALQRDLVLDRSGHWLAELMQALGHTEDFDQIPQLAFGGMAGVLANSDPVSIMTSIAAYCVKCNRRTAGVALEIALKKLKEEVEKIDEDVSNLTTDYQTRKKLESYCRGEKMRIEAKRARTMKMTLTSVSEENLQMLLSKPMQLTVEFEDGINHIREQVARSTNDEVRINWEETYYWPMIKAEGENLVQKFGPLPKPRGPSNGVSQEERQATKELVIAKKFGSSNDNVLKYGSFWKLLSDLRTNGVTLMLLYRTQEFKTNCFKRPNELETLLSWDKVYGPALQRLRLRVIAEEANDFSGKCDVLDKDILKRTGARMEEWANDSFEWLYASEKEECKLDHKIEPTSCESTAHVLLNGLSHDSERNKSVFIDLVRYEVASEEIYYRNKSAVSKRIAVCPVVPVAAGDFLGTFPGALRYTKQDLMSTSDVQGPVSGLWLDRSKVTGKLSRMKIAAVGEKTNVCLVWEEVNEAEEGTFCESFRVLVVATRHIMAFEQLIRPA